MTNHCTHEQSLALKEIGFDMPVRDYYLNGRRLVTPDNENWNAEYFSDSTFSAPTRSEVLQWAREKKGMFGSVRMFTDGIVAEWGYVIEENPSGYYLYDSIEHGREYPTHPEAESALVDKIIELIKEKITTPSAE